MGKKNIVYLSSFLFWLFGIIILIFGIDYCRRVSNNTFTTKKDREVVPKLDKSSYTKHTTRENYSDLYGKFYRRKVSGGDTISSTLRRSMNYFYNPQKDCLLAN